MNPNDIKSFLAKESELHSDDYVFFTYTFETTIDPIEAAAGLCCETSTAQWARPNVNEDFRPRHAAKLLSLEVLEKSGISAFYDKGGSGEPFIRARARIAHPLCNFGDSIPGLLTVAMGEGAFFSHGISAIKLVDIEFPEGCLKNFDGPRFGVAGLRNFVNVYERPLFLGVVKPNIGLLPDAFADIAYEGLAGGLDAAKDDEMICDPDYSPFAERMKLVGMARRRAEDETGEKKIYIGNITHEISRLRELYDIAVKSGVNAVMLNVMAVGLSAVRYVRSFSEVPIVAHFDCIAPMSMHPWFGVETSVITKLERLCGCDVIIMPGFGARMKTPDEEVLRNTAECVKKLGVLEKSLPAPGGSDWAGTVPAMFNRLKTCDFAMVPGRGVFGHPMGPRGGALSMRQAWSATAVGVSLSDYAKDHEALFEALKFFGGKS